MGTKSVTLFTVGLNSNQPWIEKLYQDENNLQKKENKPEAESKVRFQKTHLRRILTFCQTSHKRYPYSIFGVTGEMNIIS